MEHFSELTQLTDENNNKVPICICSKNKTSELCEPTLFGDDGFWEHSLINIKGKSVGILKNDSNLKEYLVNDFQDEMERKLIEIIKNEFKEGTES